MDRMPDGWIDGYIGGKGPGMGSWFCFEIHTYQRCIPILGRLSALWEVKMAWDFLYDFECGCDFESK